MVKVRGRNSNGKTVKQTVKNGRKSRVTTPRGRLESLVPGVSSSRLRPDSDQSRIWCRARPWLVCDSLNELTWVRFVVHWHLTIFFFFFFFCRFVSVVWQDSDRVQSVIQDRVYMVQRKRFEVVLRFLVDRYRRTKPPKPDASQFVVPARFPKPVIGSGGLSSSRFDDDVPEVNCTWTASFSWRGESRKLRFGSNRTAPKIWQEGQHDFHSPPQPIDWREHTIGAVDDRNLPTRSLQVPESYENFLWHRVKVEASWLDCVTMMSDMTIGVTVVSASCHHLTRADSGWSRISWFSRVTLPWLRGGTSVAPWRHKWSHVPVFPPSVWPSSCSNFDLGPSPSDSTEKTLSYQSLWFWSAVFL